MMQRDPSIDIAKAITIILMIVGHCDALIPSWLYKAIFSFHVPLFFSFQVIYSTANGHGVRNLGVARPHCYSRI